MARTLNAGARLKRSLMKEHEDCFEPLTFGELKIGQRFIGFPLPGDNHGHGGFMKAHYIFTKTREGTNGFDGEAKRERDGNISTDPDSMFVILVE